MIVALLNKVDSISQQFVLNGYQQLVNTYSPAIYALASLCVIIYGYAALQGWVSLSLAETSKRVLTIGFVLAFALNWGTFSDYVYRLFTQVPNEISGILIKAIPNSIYDTTGGINSALQQAWYDGFGFVSALWERGGLQNWFPYFWAAAVFVIVLLLVSISLIELIVAKFGLAIFLVLAPLIIPMMLFKATKEIIFDGWLKHLITFAFVPIFVTSALALGLSLLSDSVGTVQQAISADNVSITKIAPYVLFAVVCLGLVIKATHMAASIANGFTTGMSPHLGRAAGNLLRTIMNNLPRLQPRSNNSVNGSTSTHTSTSTPVNPTTIASKK